MLSNSINNPLSPAYQKAVEKLKGNPQQLRVFESQSNCVVLAGPGSGKTHTLTVKLARMLQEDVHMPRGIACITYSNECARELKKRLNVLGISEVENIYVGTVHGFCMTKILIPYGKLANSKLPTSPQVASPTIQDRYLQDAKTEVYGSSKAPKDVGIHFYRRTYLDRDTPQWTNGNEKLALVIESYEARLHQEGYIDFDDMVLNGLWLVEQNEWILKLLTARFPILVVDEYQDLGLALHRLVKNLCFRSSIRLLAVGDPDQSIYGFMGANPSLLKELAAGSNTEDVSLRMNYRCATDIIRASELVAGKPKGEFSSPEGTSPGFIYYYLCSNGLLEQAETICEQIIPNVLAKRPGRKLGNIAILYLDKFDGDVIAKAAATANLEFIRIDKNAPYPKTPLTRWLEDCAQWCCIGWKDGKPSLSNLVRSWIRFNGKMAASDQQIRELKRQLIRFLWTTRTADMPLNTWLKKFIEDCLCLAFHVECDQQDEFEALSSLCSACSAGGSLENFTLATFAGQGGSPNYLNLITLHSSKGLEYEVVIMMGMDQGRIPWINDLNKAEKRRQFYVGLTRAQQEVHITYSGTYTDYYGISRRAGPSEFILEIQKKLDTGEDTRFQN